MESTSLVTFTFLPSLGSRTSWASTPPTRTTRADKLPSPVTSHNAAAVFALTAAAASSKKSFERRLHAARSGKIATIVLMAIGGTVDPHQVPTEEEAKLLQDVLQEVKELVILQKASQATRARLAQSMVLITASEGDVIVRQGELVDFMYIVSDGQIEIQREDAEIEDTLRKVGACGSYFGAESLLGNTPQKTTVIAKSNCRIWRLERGVFDAAILAQQQAPGASGEDEDDEDGDGQTCASTDLKEIFVVSDSTGESASASVRTALQQFNYCYGGTCGTSRTTVYRFMRSEEEAKKIVAAAKEKDALLVFTVMDLNLHAALTKCCSEFGVECCDLWGTLLSALEKKFGAKRSGQAGRKQAVNDEYMRIVRAIEYTRKVDDGVLPNAWHECDIMLIGPSRAGKTPLSFYLAQRGYKVANYPLVPDEDPPKELFQIDQSKCFALFIKPERLRAIRVERMKQFNRADTSYASLANIQKEINWIKTFYMRRGPTWPIIDTTDAGVVETAARIMEIFDRRKGDSVAAAYESPLT